MAVIILREKRTPDCSTEAQRLVRLNALMSLGQSQTVCMCVLTDMAESQVLILKNIGDAIAGVLPDLPDQLLKSVEDTLKKTWCRNHR